MTTRHKARSLVGVEATYFTTILIDASALRAVYDKEFFGFQNQYNIQDDEFEDVYDWMVTEAVNEMLAIPNRSVVVGHYKHDVYRAFYDHFKYIFEGFIRQHNVVKKIKYPPGTKVKLLVAGPTIYLVKQGTFNE